MTGEIAAKESWVHELVSELGQLNGSSTIHSAKAGVADRVTLAVKDHADPSDKVKSQEEASSLMEAVMVSPGLTGSAIGTS